MRKFAIVAVAVGALEVWTLSALFGGVQTVPARPLWPLSADPECAATMVRPPDMVFTDDSAAASTWVPDAAFATLSEHDGAFVRLSGFFHDSFESDNFFASHEVASAPPENWSGDRISLTVDVQRLLSRRGRWREALLKIVDRCVRVEGRLRMSDNYPMDPDQLTEVRRVEVWSKPYRPVPPRR
jgi:hypothetical protein